MIGLSTSWCACNGLSIYDSVKKVRDMGFSHAELGANHKLEKNMEETIRKIKKDFGDMTFTLHGYFPPIFEEPHFVNLCEGPNKTNKKIMDNMFHSGEVLEAKVISMHQGSFRTYSGVKPFEGHPGCTVPVYSGRMDSEQATLNFKENIHEALKKSEDAGIKFAVETDSWFTDKPLDSFEAYKNILTEFPKLGILLDLGHALVTGNVDDYLTFGNKIYQMHVHDNHGKEDDHLPIGRGLLEVDKVFSQSVVKKIPLIFEHDGNTKEEDIKKEKELLEKLI